MKYARLEIYIIQNSLHVHRKVNHTFIDLFMQELLWMKYFHSLCISCLFYSNHSFIYCILLCFVKVLISMAFIFSYFFLVFSKPLYPKTPFPRSHYSQVRDSQPLSDAVEPEEDISQESNNTNDVTGFLESPTAHDRIARNAHPCISKVVREFEPCRNLWVEHQSANQCTASEMLHSLPNVLRYQ